jgi:hypothetical protein
MENGKEYIEYPQNYEEIVARKLAQLEKDYETTIKANFNEDEFNEDEGSETITEENKNNSECDDKRVSDNNYYQCLDDMNEEDNHIETVDEEFVEVIEDDIVTNVVNTMQNVQIGNGQNDIDSAPEIKIKDPIKNPEKIKEAMKKIKLPTPIWAKQ